MLSMSVPKTTPPRTGVRACAARRQSPSGFATAVSLHAHTHHSQEVLADFPSYIARIPVVAGFFQREMRAYSQRNGLTADFRKGWWNPPLSPAEVYESELVQIQACLGLAPLVSISDHGNIDAGLELQAQHGSGVPLSLEWTVPFEEGFFHLGVHNLPAGAARDLFDSMTAYSRADAARRLADLLDTLNAARETLIVLNHPLWDLASLGSAAHERLLRRFLAEHGDRLHGLELNGYRPWRENDVVRALAADAGVCAVSGGDRHGCAPNALLNLTNASSFGEFVHEIRVEGISEIVVMPGYRERLAARKLAVAADVLRPNPAALRGHWTDRVSCEWRGVVRPLAHHWPGGGPLWVRTAIRAFQVATSRRMMPILRLCLPRDEQPAFDRHAPLGTPAGPLAAAADGGPRESQVSA
jgi:hypothetical protein